MNKLCTKHKDIRKIDHPDGEENMSHKLSAKRNSRHFFIFGNLPDLFDIENVSMKNECIVTSNAYS